MVWQIFSVVFHFIFLDCTAPFIVGIVTDAVPGAGDQVANDMGMKVQRGVCLEYKQIPCN